MQTLKCDFTVCNWVWFHFSLWSLQALTFPISSSPIPLIWSLRKRIPEHWLWWEVKTPTRQPGREDSSLSNHRVRRVHYILRCPVHPGRKCSSDNFLPGSLLNFKVQTTIISLRQFIPIFNNVRKIINRYVEVGGMHLETFFSQLYWGIIEKQNFCTVLNKCVITMLYTWL